MELMKTNSLLSNELSTIVIAIKDDTNSSLKRNTVE